MNEKAINTAVKLHREKFKGLYISPVSEADVKIVDLLMEAARRLGGPDVTGVMKDWKVVADDDVRKELEKVVVNIIPPPIGNLLSQQGGGRGRSGVLTFNDFDASRCDATEVYSWKKTLDEFGNPGILINEGDLDATKRPAVFNWLLAYPSEEARDRDFDSITMQKNGR